MNPHCQPKGSMGGSREWDELFGPQGWCMTAEPKIECDCSVPGRRCGWAGIRGGWCACSSSSG